MRSIHQLLEKKHRGEKIVCTTCYDSTMARLLYRSEIDLILVGDSAGNVMMGHPSTIAVTNEDMVRYSACVTRVLGDDAKKIIIADIPFMSYATVPLAIENATALMQKGGVHGVKLEGASTSTLEAIALLVDHGIPVMGHLGFTPQSWHTLGGPVVCGKDPTAARMMVQHAKKLSNAGVFSLVLEMVPKELAAQITQEIPVPVIGIGAGGDVDGQILVLQDLLGMSPHTPRFAKVYAPLATAIEKAVSQYCAEVRKGEFPLESHSYSAPL